MQRFSSTYFSSSVVSEFEYYSRLVSMEVTTAAVIAAGYAGTTLSGGR